MHRQRLLVTMSFSFSVRYLYRTGLLAGLKKFSDVVVAITWDEAALIEALTKEGFEVHIVPESQREPAYNDTRRMVGSKSPFRWNDFH